MRFQHVIEAVYFSPWLITPAGWASIDSLVSARILNQPKAERPTEDYFGDPLPQMTIAGGVATIPIHGVIGVGLGTFEKSCGAVDTQDISDELAQAVNTPSVRRIILDMNSPGGTVGGVPELAAQIVAANATKPVDAFVGPGCLNCSAAQWITAGCRGIYAASSATVGSVGVYLPVVDRTKFYEAMGVKVDLIKAGKFKGMGYPGTSLSGEQRDYLQSDIDATHAEFKAFVQSHRTRVPDDALEGQTFSGRQGAEVGLVTGLRNSLDELLAG